MNNVGKIALVLGGLVIIGLIIFALISNVMPASFEFVGCAFKAFLNPSQTGGTVSSCGDAFMNGFKFN